MAPTRRVDHVGHERLCRLASRNPTKGNEVETERSVVTVHGN
jgi:hypothetical protein